MIFVVTRGLDRSCRLADHRDINVFIAILGIPDCARIGCHGSVNSQANGGGGSGGGGGGGGYDAVPLPVPLVKQFHCTGVAQLPPNQIYHSCLVLGSYPPRPIASLG